MTLLTLFLSKITGLFGRFIVSSKRGGHDIWGDRSGSK